MKASTLLLAIVLLAGPAPYRAEAQPATQDFRPEQIPAALPAYVYCEIRCDAEPTFAENGVVFDFGQKTGAWRYNYLRDDQGNPYLFKSGIEALNYMVCRGWELVTAFSCGKDNASKHYLLRIPVELLPEQVQQQLTEEPRRKKTGESK